MLDHRFVFPGSSHLHWTITFNTPIFVAPCFGEQSPPRPFPLHNPLPPPCPIPPPNITNPTPHTGLVPDIIDVREISVHIAKAVIKQAIEEHLATEKDIPAKDEDLEEWIREQMWEPRYRPLVRVERGKASRLGRGEVGVGGGAGG